MICQPVAQASAAHKLLVQRHNWHFGTHMLLTHS